MKDPLDPGTIELPVLYDQNLINAVANLETVFTVEGTKATPENEAFVAKNIKFDRSGVIDKHIKDLEEIKLLLLKVLNCLS
jgi:allophanate hydrolase subunit 1